MVLISLIYLKSVMELHLLIMLVVHDLKFLILFNCNKYDCLFPHTYTVKHVLRHYLWDKEKVTLKEVQLI